MYDGLYPKVGRGRRPCPDVLTWFLGSVHMLPTWQRKVKVAGGTKVASKMISRLGWPFWIIQVESLFVDFFEIWSYSGSSSWPSFQMVAQAVFKLTVVLLAQPPEYGDYNHESPHMTWFFLSIFIIYFAVCAYVYHSTCGGQRIILKSQFSPATLWDPRLSGLRTSTATHRVHRDESGRPATVQQSDMHHNSFRILEWGQSPGKRAHTPTG